MNITAKFKCNSLFVVVFAFMAFSCKKDDACIPATLSIAGEDQNVIGTTATLAANVPSSGVGTWSIVSGVDGEIAEPLNAASAFTGTLGTSYVLKWTITGCPSSEDDVAIIFSCDPTLIANAGADQTVSGTSATLNANATISGTGSWSILSGTGGNITEATNPASTFTGVTGTTYVLRWTVSCPASEDDVQVSFVTPGPKLLTVDKTSVINGEIITLTGVDFASNYNGGSQVNISKIADPLMGQEVFLPILSRTATEIKAVMIGSSGGTDGAYALRYLKKPDSSPATIIPSSLSVSVVTVPAGQFFTSQAFTSNSPAKGAEASFGIKNGSTVAADYTIKLIQYNYTTGVATEYDAVITGITALGFGGSMDKLAFTIPASLPSNPYYVKVTYGGKSLIGGWGQALNIF